MKHRIKSIILIFLLFFFLACLPKPKPEYVDIVICTESGLIQNFYCPTIEIRRFEKGKQPTEICQMHKALEYVEIEVCKVSGFLPNKFWCQETETQKFEKGKEPTLVCNVHKKPSIKKLLYVAAYDILASDGDKEKFIKTVALLGADFRVMFQYAWGDNVLSPYPQIGFWKAGYADAPDLAFYDQGTEDVPAWNSQYWAKVDELNSLLTYYERGIYADVHEGCSFRMGGWPKYRYPFLSSSPDRSKDDPEVNRYPGGFWGMQESSGGRITVQFLHERFIRKLVEGWRSKGIPFKVEFVNEDPMTDWDDAYVKEYYKWLMNMFADLGVSKENIIGSGRQAGIEYLGLYSVHGISRPEDIPNSNFPHDYPHGKLMISTDGGFSGQGRSDARGRRGPDGNQVAGIAQKVLDLGCAGLELMDRGIYLKNNDKANLDDFDPEIFIRAVGVLKK